MSGRQDPAVHRIVLERTVQAEPRQVWDVLTDVGRADRVLRGVTHVELLTEGPYAVGTRWRETRRMLGTQRTEELRVTGAQAPTRTVVEAASKGVRYVTEFTLASVPDGGAATRLAMHFSAEQPDAGRVQRALTKVLGRLGATATRKVMAQDLEDIAAAAERR